MQNLFDTPRSQIVQMTTDQSRMFMGMTMAELDPKNAAQTNMTIDEVIAHAEEQGLMNVFTLAVLAQRLKAGTANVRYSFYTVVFLASLCKTPGESVLWAWSLYRKSIEANEAITMGRLAHYFPMGFPNEQAIEEAWDAQKGAAQIGGNKLDTDEAWA